jgi:hypothetical protein
MLVSNIHLNSFIAIDGVPVFHPEVQKMNLVDSIKRPDHLIPLLDWGMAPARSGDKLVVDKMTPHFIAFVGFVPNRGYDVIFQYWVPCPTRFCSVFTLQTLHAQREYLPVPAEPCTSNGVQSHCSRRPWFSTNVCVCPIAMMRPTRFCGHI